MHTTFDQAEGTTGKDRRRSERYNLDCKVQWKPKDVAGTQWRDESLLDISVSGAAFTCAEEIATGTRITLKITPPEVMPDAIMAQPVLIHCVLRNQLPLENGKFRSGVEFDRVYFLFAEWIRLLQAKSN
ncbi:MAG: PilZ domain-containing protein [Verrucomicrobia bacterium]|nr:PilZ domain-containing protein [Verrucomicrobiota bacterium]